MKKIIFALLLLSSNSAFSEVEDTIRLKEIVISASKWEQEVKNVPSRVVGINAKENVFQNPQTAADMLQNSGQVFVQKSQTGGGSPVIRGFETNRILMVIDGVRMNNAIYRGGHVQDVITLDNAILDKTEILFGPSSTMYGSDALGGVIHFYTKNPILNQFGGNAYMRYSSANNEKSGHVDFNLSFGKIASLTSVSYSDFGDLKVGKNGDFGTPNGYGKSFFYVTRDTQNNTDVVKTNSIPDIMLGSAYKQIDLLQKVLFQQNVHVSHLLNLQYSTNIGNVPRYDRMLEVTYDNSLTPLNPVYAQWDYGPQTRFLGAYTLDVKVENNLFDDAKFILSYQSIDQDRISRKLNKSNRKTQMEDVNVFSANFDLTKKLSDKTVLYYGLEETFNNVKSTVTNIDIVTGANAGPAATRYPDGGNVWNSAALYAQTNTEISDILSMTGGLRLSSVYMNSKFKNDPLAGNVIFPFDETKLNKIAPSGNISLVANLASKTKISTILSTGFRAPNIDDMTKFFDNTTNETVVVPNENLQPEYAYNAEMNITQSVGSMLKIEAGAYFTILDNAMTVQATKFNALDSILVDGDMLKAMSIQNVNSATIWGFYADATLRPIKYLSLNATINSTFGKYKDENASIVPMDHIPPMFAKVSAAYTLSNMKFEAFVRFSAAKKLEDYSPSGEDNLTQTAITGIDSGGNFSYAGTPSWYTLNFRAAYDVMKNLSVNAGIENILDRHYRQFASGISSPGRNIYGTVRLKF